MSSKHILIVGGAGYIGSHMVEYLTQSGYIPIVLDNLSTGHADSVAGTPLYVGHLVDQNLLDDLFEKYSFQAVMHFASFIQVGESVLDPAKYYKNNVGETLHLLQAMLKWKVNKFIFSSTAAVYGEPEYTPIDENHPVKPINPYGHSKRMVEQMLEDYAKAYDFRFMSLRYFNAAGAHPSGKLAEHHEPETHLIPLVLQVAKGKKEYIQVYGNDYATRDGSCIRDYIHVMDLCSAHLLALQALDAGENSRIYNLGTGLGYSVYEVIEMVRHVTNKHVNVVTAARRSGDPAVLMANPERAMKELQWTPQYPDLNTIVTHAWQSF